MNQRLTQVHCVIDDETQVGAARRQAKQYAESASLGEVLTGHAAIVATELASNIWKHAGGGELLIQQVSDGTFEGLELLAVDRGPGIVDIGRSLEDGHSTAGTPGTGLGAVRRLSSVFDVHSEQGKGCVVMSRIGTPRETSALLPSWGAVMSFAPGEQVSGDQWAMSVQNGDTLTLMVVDGVGHGVLAHDAATIAVRLFHQHASEAPGTLLHRLHAGLSSSRGAAIAIARANLATGTVTYAGAGNIVGNIIQRDSRQRGLVTMNGTVGSDQIHVREYQYQWSAGELLVMHSDGLRSHWSLADRPGLASRHPAVVAAVLHRDHLRGRDDATVVALSR